MSMILRVSNALAARIKPVLAAGVWAVLLACSTTAMARQRGPAAVIFSDGEFSGKSQPLDVGDYDTDDLALGNDRISSVHVAPGYRVILYKNTHFSGKTREITEDTPHLGNFNDDTSSIRVERMSRRDQQPAYVVIYSDANFSGRSQELGNGDYDRDDLQIGNDRLSSLRVAPGCRVTLFADEHFSGAAAVVTSDAASLPRFNDTASSIHVDCR